MWFVNVQTEVAHKCSKEDFDRFYAGNDDYQIIPDVVANNDIEDAVIVETKKTKKELIAEAKALGVKGADRMSKEDLEKAVE